MSLTKDMAFLDSTRLYRSGYRSYIIKHSDTERKNALSKHCPSSLASFGDMAFLDAALNPVTEKSSIADKQFDADRRNAMSTSYFKQINQAE